MKYILGVCVFFLVVFCAYSQELSVEVELKNIAPGKGTVYLAVYDSAEGYKKQKPFLSKIIEPVSGNAKLELLLPVGEYVLSAFQDTNNNKKLDTNLIGMPKEPVGISNYEGKGIPGGFDKLKTPIQKNETVLTVNLIQL